MTDLLGLARAAVDRDAYATPIQTSALSPEARAACQEVLDLLERGQPEGAVGKLEELHRAGLIDVPTRQSLRHVVAASPHVGDFEAAEHYTDLHERAARQLEVGPYRDQQMSAVERHRGFVALRQGRYEDALDHYTRALQWVYSPLNLTNAMAALLGAAGRDEAKALLEAVRHSHPRDFVMEVDRIVTTDPDFCTLAAA